LIRHLDRFDLAVLITVTVLLSAIGVTVSQWALRPRPPQIVYLGPVQAGVQNLFIVDPGTPERPKRLTDSQDGILGYDVSADGRRIVYSEVIYTEGQSTGSTRLSMLDVPSGKTETLYECKEAACTGLAWRPDGGAFAFQRVDVNASTMTGPGAARTWIFDLTSNEAYPLFRDNQQLGYMPRWSPDGRRIAVFSVSAGGIIVHDFASGKDNVIPDNQAELGTFSPDGRWLYFPKVAMMDESTAGIHLVLVDLTAEPYTLHDLIPDSVPVSDVQAVWRSDSKALIVARQPANRALTQGPQLFIVDVASGAASLLPGDSAYDITNLSVNGTSLLFQRMPLGEAAPRPETWVLNLSSGEKKLVGRDGTYPRWLLP
jgi:Tol biopolymer transport system component